MYRCNKINILWDTIAEPNALAKNSIAENNTHTRRNAERMTSTMATNDRSDSDFVGRSLLPRTARSNQIHKVNSASIHSTHTQKSIQLNQFGFIVFDWFYCVGLGRQTITWASRCKWHLIELSRKRRRRRRAEPPSVNWPIGNRGLIVNFVRRHSIHVQGRWL